MTYGGSGSPAAMTYTYNLGGAMVEQQYPSGRVVKNTLDATGDLSMVTSKENSSAIYKTYVNDFTYNAAGAVTSLKLGNGKFESTQFNSRLQPTQIALGASVGDTSSLKLDYSYGDWNGSSIDATKNNGNIVQQVITTPTVGSSSGFTATQKYYYDSLNRIDDSTETISSTQTWRQDFTYDRYGNRRFNETNTSMPASFSNQALTNPTISTSNNRLTSTGWTYDASGNTTGDPQSRTFIYDGENKQVEVKNSSSATIGQYSYDGDGRRVKKYVPSTGETTIFVYDAAGKQIAEYSTIVADSSSAKVSYLTNDHLGSPRINTGVAGTVVARHDYYPFGEEIATAQRTTALNYSGDTVRKQFTGYERDSETESDFAQARTYVAPLGRFNQIDPILISKEHPSNPQRWNAYIYVVNNPTVFTDPDGKKPKRIIDVFISMSEITNLDKARWKQLQRDARKAGARINIYGIDKKNPATAAGFLRSVSTPGRTTIYAGHSIIRRDIYAAHFANGSSYRGGGVGISFAGRQLVTKAATEDTENGEPGGIAMDGKTMTAKNIVVLSCDFGETFANSYMKKGSNFIWADPGEDGGTGSTRTINLQAQEMAATFAKGGSAWDAAVAAQNVFNNNPFGDSLDGEIINISDGQHPRP